MFRPPMVAIIRLYTLKMVNYYNMQIQFDVEILNTITFIGFTDSNNTVGIQSVELVVCSRLVSRVYNLTMATMGGRNM
jgi:hypothetical protein